MAEETEEMEKKAENTDQVEDVNADDPSESPEKTPSEEIPGQAESAVDQGEVPPEEPAEEPAETEAAEAPQEEALEEEASEEEVLEEAKPEDQDAAETQEEVEIEEADEAPVEPEPAETEKAPAEKAPAARSKASEFVILPDEKTSQMKWYVIHAHSGHENKVKQSLENRVRQQSLEESIAQVLVPSEEVAEVKGGKKRITSRKIFPGYVLVEMKLSHKTWYLVRTTPGVTGFIGSGKKPTALEPAEIESIFEQMRGEKKAPKPKVEFEKDERVKIIEGPFSNFMGVVDEINSERGKLKVLVEIFERMTSVELEFWQVEKI